MNYIQLSGNHFSKGDYSVTALRKEDIFLIRDWRNAQMSVLRQNAEITEEQQLSYYENIVVPGFSDNNTKIMLFSFMYNEKCIGYGGLTNIKWTDKHVELSFLVDPERAADVELYKMDFTHFISLMKQVAFDEMDFNRIFTETYDIRPLHIGILENNGFQQEGRMREHVKIDGKFTDSLIHGFIKSDYEY